MDGQAFFETGGTDSPPMMCGWSFAKVDEVDADEVDGAGILPDIFGMLKVGFGPALLLDALLETGGSRALTERNR